MSVSTYSQSYNDLFTEYKSVTPQQRPSVSVPKYEVMDPSKYAPGRQTQRTSQMFVVNGVYVRDGRFYSVKMKAIVSELNGVVVKAYYKGQRWWIYETYASSVGYGAPVQIRDACEYEVSIPGLGKVYF